MHAELAAFGVPAFPPDTAAAAGKVTENHTFQVEVATAVFRSWDNAYGGGLRRKAVIGQLAEVTSLLGGPFTSEQAARRLYSAAADLAQLAGWMSWDLQLHATAQHYYLLALALARDAGDRPQVARLMYCLARQQIDLGRPGEALELAAAGAYAIRRTSSPKASALLHIAQARAYACLGEERDCRAALRAAQETYARDGAGGRPGMVRLLRRRRAARLDRRHPSRLAVRCPPVSGQGSNRISPGKGRGNVGGTEKVQSGI